MRPRYGIATSLGTGTMVRPERWFWTRRAAKRQARVATLACQGRQVWQVVAR